METTWLNLKQNRFYIWDEILHLFWFLSMNIIKHKVDTPTVNCDIINLVANWSNNWWHWFIIFIYVPVSSTIWKTVISYLRLYKWMNNEMCSCQNAISSSLLYFLYLTRSMVIYWNLPLVIIHTFSLVIYNSCTSSYYCCSAFWGTANVGIYEIVT